MSIIKPTFPDGIVVKTEDLQRLLSYTSAVEQSFLKFFGPGIISGVNISYVYTAGVFPAPNTITVTVTGPAVIAAQNQELIILDSADTLTGTFVYANAVSGIDLYIYEQSISPVDVRPNLAHISCTIATKSTYALSEVPTFTPSTPGKFAKIATIINPDLPTTYKALSTLIHTNEYTGSTYTGPLLNGTTAIVPLSIGNGSLADNCILERNITDGQVTSSKIAAGSITHTHLTPDCVESDNIADNAIFTDHIADAQITPAKLSFSVKAGVSAVLDLPKTFIVPGKQTGTPVANSLYDFASFDVSSSQVSARNWPILTTWTNTAYATPVAIPANLKFSYDYSVSTPAIKTYNLPFVQYSATTPAAQGAANFQNILFSTTEASSYPQLYNAARSWIALDYSLDLETYTTVDSYWYPNYLKPHNYLMAQAEYPAGVTFSGLLPVVRWLYLPSGLYSSRTHNSIAHIPWIIAPDGYFITSIHARPMYNMLLNQRWDINSMSYLKETVDQDGGASEWIPAVELTTASGTSIGTIRGPVAKAAFFLNPSVIQNPFRVEPLCAVVTITLVKATATEWLPATTPTSTLCYAKVPYSVRGTGSSPYYAGYVWKSQTN